jgi:hypothetical protein
MSAPNFLQVLLLPLCFAGIVGLTGCQPVPLAGDSSQKPKQPPVKPLYPGNITGTVHDGKQPKGSFEIVSPGGKTSGKTPKPTAKAGSKPSPGATIDVSQQLADAADKAASAESLAQFAQTQDDWNGVFDRWKKAIAILKSAPQTPAIQQKLAAYNSGLSQATQAAQLSMNPSLAPVDPTGSRATKALVGGGGGPEPTPSAAPKPGDKPSDKPADAPKAGESPAPIAPG